MSQPDWVENFEKGLEGKSPAPHSGGAPGRAHFVDAEAEKAFREMMGRLTGEDGDEEADEDHGDVGS
jgi:hypothetical protein